jgi:hypothetical protein
MRSTAEATTAQRLARLEARHRRLLTATARLVEGMKWLGLRVYEAAPADVLAVRTAVSECSRHSRIERKS